MTTPRPAARSCIIPPALAAKLAPELARALGADEEAAAALAAALGRGGAYACTLIVHRADDELLSARDLAALRGLAPGKDRPARAPSAASTKTASARTKAKPEAKPAAAKPAPEAAAPAKKRRAA